MLDEFLQAFANAPPAAQADFAGYLVYGVLGGDVELLRPEFAAALERFTEQLAVPLDATPDDAMAAVDAALAQVTLDPTLVRVFATMSTDLVAADKAAAVLGTEVSRRPVGEQRVPGTIAGGALGLLQQRTLLKPRRS